MMPAWTWTDMPDGKICEMGLKALEVGTFSSEHQMVRKAQGGSARDPLPFDFARKPSHPDTLQRFRFCGDQDCPDWLLAEIVLLTKIVRPAPALIQPSSCR
jgi:hypothetical protein